MIATSVTLLQRLREPESAHWPRFVDLYTPLLLYWARRLGLGPADAADLIQDVLVILVRRMPSFEYRPGQSFRGWLRTVALNQWKHNRRKAGRLAATMESRPLAAPAGPDPFEEQEYARVMVHRGLDLIRGEFSPAAWEAFRRHVLDDLPAAEVAAALGLQVGTVYAAKSRVFRRLREELEGLVDLD